MSKSVRYELLRRAKILPEIYHRSVGGAIMASLLESPSIQISDESFIPKSFVRINLRDIRLGWGEGMNLETNKPTAIYIVERVTFGPFYKVRSILKDKDGYPLKSDYRVVEQNLTLFEAHMLRTLMQDKTSYRFFDVVPEDF